jgi:hypothetical protein
VYTAAFACVCVCVCVCVYMSTLLTTAMGVVEISIRALLPYTARIIYLAMAFTETYHSYLDRDWRSLASFLKAINPPVDLPQNIESRPYHIHTHAYTRHDNMWTSENKIFFSICLIRNLFAGVLFLLARLQPPQPNHYLYAKTDGISCVCIYIYI